MGGQVLTTDCGTQATQGSQNTAEPSPYGAGLMVPLKPLVGGSVVIVIMPGTVHGLTDPPLTYLTLP